MLCRWPLTVLLLWNSAGIFGTTISSNIYEWTQLPSDQKIEVRVDVLDNFQGDYSRAEWRYTVRNIDYLAAPYTTDLVDFSRGLQTSFYLPFRLPASVASRGDLFSSFYAPDAWVTVYNYVPGYSELFEFLPIGHNEGVAWVTWQPCSPHCETGPNFPVAPGSSAVFGFAMKKPVMIGEISPFQPFLETDAIIMQYKWFAVSDMSGYVLTPGPQPVPEVPEPFTAVLVGAGLIGIALLHRRRRALLCHHRECRRMRKRSPAACHHSSFGPPITFLDPRWTTFRNPSPLVDMSIDWYSGLRLRGLQDILTFAIPGAAFVLSSTIQNLGLSWLATLPGSSIALLG